MALLSQQGNSAWEAPRAERDVGAQRGLFGQLANFPFCGLRSEDSVKSEAQYTAANSRNLTADPIL